MRILILGNMANDGYSVAKALWKMNKDVDLAVNSSDFGMALPEWEDGDISETTDPYTIHRNEIKNTSLGRRIRYFDFLNKAPRKKNMIGKIMARINLMRMIREYDIVEVHAPFIIYDEHRRISGSPTHRGSPLRAARAAVARRRGLHQPHGR